MQFLRLFSLLLTLMLGALPVGGTTAVPPTDAPLEAFYYRYGGMVQAPIMGIDVCKSEDGYEADFLLGTFYDVEGVALSEADMQRLGALIDEYDIWAWAGFDESDPYILDGEDFTLSARFADGTQIDAHGSNAFPKGYFDAQYAILSSIEEIMSAQGIALEY